VAAVVGSQCVVSRDELAAFDGGLADEYAVEPIAMLGREMFDRGAIDCFDPPCESLDAGGVPGRVQDRQG
jgi:hypothetical protein